MRCFFPITIYCKTTKKSQSVPCGKCAACLSTRRSQWAFRLQQELKQHLNAHFITLTYDEEKIPLNTYYDSEGVITDFKTLRKTDVQKWLKRLRKQLDPIKIRYFLVGEYGTRTHRPHYHAIMFGIPSELDVQSLIVDTWKHGHVLIGTVNSKSIAYVTKYCIKQKDHNEYIEKEFSLMSKRPALGSNYIQSHSNWHLSDYKRNYCVLEGGFKVSLPRYYKDKIYTDKFEKLKVNLTYEREQIKKWREDFRDFYCRNPDGNFFKSIVEYNTNANELIFKRIKQNHKF